MSREKQIEETAFLVCEMANKPNSCRECGGRHGGCFTIPKIKILCEAGYRKQSEVAREIFAEIKKILDDYSTEQHYQGQDFVQKSYDCDLESAIDELKKKYYEEFVKFMETEL